MFSSECCPASNGLVEAGVKVRYPLQDLEGRGHRLGVFWMEEEVASVQFPSVVLFCFFFCSAEVPGSRTFRTQVALKGPQGLYLVVCVLVVGFPG